LIYGEVVRRQNAPVVAARTPVVLLRHFLPQALGLGKVACLLRLGRLQGSLFYVGYFLHWW